MVAAFREGTQSEWSYRVREQYESERRVIRVIKWYYRSRTEADIVQRSFYEHAERWKNETRHWSSLARRFAHPSYLRIVALAKYSTDNELERLILQELREDPDHWFDALTAITGDDPIQPNHGFDEAVEAWLEWGRKKGIA